MFDAAALNIRDRRNHVVAHPLHGGGGAFVQMGHMARRGEEHMLTNIHNDENMGHKRALDKRKGPFKGKSGKSRVMSRSSGVLIRKRDNTLEITVHKKVTQTELDILKGKLRAHAMAKERTSVFLIVRSQERYLGLLINIDLDKLVHEIRSYKMVLGILLVDQFGTGGLHRPSLHSARFKRRFQRNKSLYDYF